MSQASDFRSFLTEKVNLNQSRLSLLSQRVASIENFLTSDEIFAESVNEVVPQGSFAHGTIIKPVGNKDFDADILIPMEKIEGWSPKDYVQKLYEAFGRSSHYKTMRSRKKRCVTINYTGDFHIDVVPFVSIGGATYVTNKVSDQLEVAAPDDFSEWFEAKNRVTNGNLVKVVRLLKYLRDHKTRYTVPSITLTAALAHHVSEATRIVTPDAYKNVANTLRTLSDALASQLAAYPLTPPHITDPGTGQNLADRWRNENYQTFRNRFTAYAGKIGEACDEDKYQNALKIWRELFGQEFGTVSESAVRAASFADRSVIPNSEQFLDRDFNIPEKLDSSLRFKTVGYLIPKRGFRHGQLPKRGNRVGKHRSLRFKIVGSNVPEPYDVYWKIRNYGEEAKLSNSLRGDINKDDGSRVWKETTSYVGHHYVEAMIVKEGHCVAKSRQDVIVI